MPSQFGNAQQMIDAAIRQEEKAEVVRVLGWLLLLFDAIPAVFVWVGLRIGSPFWAWWTVAEGAVGVGIIFVAARMYTRAVRLIGRGLEQKAAEEQAARTSAAEVHGPLAA